MLDRLHFWGRGLKRSTVFALTAGWTILSGISNYDTLVAHLPEPARSDWASPALEAISFQVSLAEYLLVCLTIVALFALEGSYQEFRTEREKRRKAEGRAADAETALAHQNERVEAARPRLHLEYDEKCSRCLKTEPNATGVRATFAVAVRNDGKVRADGARLTLALVEPSISEAPLGASFLTQPEHADTFTVSPGASHGAAPHLELATYQMVGGSRSLWLGVAPRKQSGMAVPRIALSLSLESEQLVEDYSFIIDAQDPDPHTVRGSLCASPAVE